jgi:beta-N-acetylhexosaminidase
MASSLKRWMHRIVAGCAYSVALTGCNYGLSSIPQQTPVMPVPVDPVQQKLQQMDLDEKIGQMIFAGIDGYELNPQTVELLESYHVGGIILYKPNVGSTGQLIKLGNALKQTNTKNKLPLWLGVDEEGGKVTRLPDELVKMPASKWVGKVNSEEFAYGVGNLLGTELNAYGLNVDFGPVLDINSNPNNPVIVDRSFGTEANIVSLMGIQTMKGLQAQHILPVVKHFPGHGDTSVDSHIGLPVVQHDLARLRKLELVPFNDAFSQQADAVMVAHILLPKVDSQYPASLSKQILSNLLRQEMGFEGLIITDDLTMGAIAQNYELGEAAVLSVIAGANVVMVGHDFEKVTNVFAALRKAVQDTRVSMDIVDQSVARIIKLKRKYQVQDLSLAAPDVKELNAAANQLLSKYLNQ